MIRSDLQPALVALLADHRLRATRTRLVAHLECEVHRVSVRAPDGSVRDLVLRIHSADSTDAVPIEAELAWLQALAEDGVHVPRPLADVEGRRVHVWRARADEAPRLAVLLEWLPGRMHDRGLTPARLHRVGVLTARLHRVGARLAAEGRLAGGRIAYMSDLAGWAGGAHDATPVLAPRLRMLARRVAGRLVDELAVTSAGNGAPGFVHGDLHPWNLVFWRDVAGAIDFSDCGWGPIALDFASTLQYLRHPLAHNHDHRAQYARLHGALLEGYASLLALPADIERQIDLHVVARMFGTLDWILQDWPRLDHRAWGPGFLRGVEDIFEAHLAR